PLGAEETRLTKENLGWPLEPAFLVPPEVREVFAARAAAGGAARKEWERGLAAWRTRHAELSTLLDAHLELRVPEDLDARLLPGMDKEGATRQHSQAVIQKLAVEVPALVGGCADLEPSTLTAIKGSGSIGLAGDGAARYAGRILHFGIREHGMAAVVN